MKYVLAVGALLFLGLSSPTMAAKAKDKCAVALENLGTLDAKVARMDEFDAEKNASVSLKLYRKALTEEALTERLPVDLIYDLYVNENNPLYLRVLRQVLEAYSKGPKKLSAEERLHNAFAAVLKNHVPESTIEERINGLEKVNAKKLIRALGDNTLEEVHELYYGGDLDKIAADSLVGKFLAETGAATLKRGFTTVPNEYDSKKVGPKRLIIAVSPAVFPQVLKYLMRPEFFSVHAHAMVSNNGKLFSYQHAGVEFRLPSAGYALPQVVLKTSEAQRLQLFFRFLADELNAGKSYNETNRAMHPWSVAGYCEGGGYVNCTHWIGNIPLGDKKVPSYTFPTQNNTPMVRKLSEYETDEHAMGQVWQSPGHEQFAKAAGLGKQNGHGNLASPGYVVHTLLGDAGLERVPIVLLVTNDHTAPIDPKFAYTTENAN